MILLQVQEYLSSLSARPRASADIFPDVSSFSDLATKSPNLDLVYSGELTRNMDELVDRTFVCLAR